MNNLFPEDITPGKKPKLNKGLQNSEKTNQ